MTTPLMMETAAAVGCGWLGSDESEGLADGVSTADGLAAAVVPGVSTGDAGAIAEFASVADGEAAAAVGGGSVDAPADSGGTADPGAPGVTADDPVLDAASVGDRLDVPPLALTAGADDVTATSDAGADGDAVPGAAVGAWLAAGTGVGTANTITLPPDRFLVPVVTTTSCRWEGDRNTVWSVVRTVGSCRGDAGAIGAQSGCAFAGQT